MKSKAEILREKLVKQLIKEKVIKSQKIKKAFQKVPRHLFIDNVKLEEIYGDFSIITKKIGVYPISSSTQPSLMAQMLENLKLQKGMKVLEIGTGTGYNAAILAEIVQDQKKVFTVDIDPDTVKKARLNLDRAGYKEISVKCLNGAKKLPTNSLYDRIIVTCSVKDFPKLWIEHLKEEGVIVAPIWINGAQITPAFKKKRNVLISFSITPAGFMEMRSKTYQELRRSWRKLPKKLIICTEHTKLFNENKVISLLQKGCKKRILLKGVAPSKRYDFFVFLSLYEKKSIELFLEKNIKGLGFKENALGIIDLKRKSACLISKDCTLLIYGTPYAYEKMLLFAHRWNNLKRPGINRLQVFVYPRDFNLNLMKDDILLKNKATQLVVKIL